MKGMHKGKKVLTRKVFTEKYTEKQRLKDFKDKMDDFFKIMMKKYNDYITPTKIWQKIKNIE